MEDERFLGVAVPTLIALGKIAIAAGRLEMTLHDVAYAFRINPTKRQAAAIAKRIRQRVVSDDLPPDARTDSERIIRWLDRTVTALNDRNEALHSAHLLLGSVPVSRHLRTDRLNQADHHQLERLAGRLAELFREGVEVESNLLPQPKTGVFIRYPRGGAFVVIASNEAGVERPTTDQIEEWRVQYSPTWGPLADD